MTRQRAWLTAIGLALAGAVPLAAVAIPALVRIPIVKPHGKDSPPEAAVFSHWSHGQYRCYACHPSIFPQAPKGFTHDDMDAGRFCGTCHDAKIAFASDESGVPCTRCHRR
jgi:c(7)-type cytochrome triheme protein